MWCKDINGLVFVSVNIIKQIWVTTETLINNITTSGEARREARREEWNIKIMSQLSISCEVKYEAYLTRPTLNYVRLQNFLKFLTIKLKSKEKSFLF